LRCRSDLFADKLPCRGQALPAASALAWQRARTCLPALLVPPRDRDVEAEPLRRIQDELVDGIRSLVLVSASAVVLMDDAVAVLGEPAPGVLDIVDLPHQWADLPWAAPQLGAEVPLSSDGRDQFDVAVEVRRRQHWLTLDLVRFGERKTEDLVELPSRLLDLVLADDQFHPVEVSDLHWFTRFDRESPSADPQETLRRVLLGAVCRPSDGQVDARSGLSS
jgi:hypothetical protein